MLRPALLVLPLSLSLVACNRGPTNRVVFEQNKALAATLDQRIAAVVKSVAAAPPPALGAPCEASGLTMDAPATLDAEKNKQGAGNTELVEWKGLSGAWSLTKPSPPGDDEIWKFEDPAGYQLRLTTFKANMPSTRDMLSPGGFLSASGEGGKTPDARTPSQALTQIERAKGITHLLVIRGQKRADNGRSQVVEVHHVEFPSGKWLCGFSYEGKVDASVEDSDTLRIKRTGGLETRTQGTNDKIGRTLRASVIDELGKELKKRFNLAGGIGPSL